MEYFEPMNIALLDELMGTSNQFKAIDMAEVISHFRSKHPASASSIDGPILDIFGVRPHEITERSFMRNLDLSINSSDLINSFDFRAQTSMDTKNFA